MSWQLACLLILALVLVTGAVWFERSRPSARILAAVAALAALGVAARLVFAPIPNVVGTTDIALLAGYTLGGPAGFAVGALSALVSNIWLGQGPWTPWQMAGWGMVGIGGAALAVVTRRRLGRVGLALAAAFAGLFYGAFLDLSAMVNFGGEQSLDRYLALSARGIPFNIAHAVGNAALMLIAGPALVRMLDRYRERFQVSWARGPGAATGSESGAVAVALIIALTLALPALQNLGPGPGRADAAARAEAASTKDGRRWLVAAQNDDGGYGTAAGASSNTGMTSWAILGLEAAGVNPPDVRSGGLSPISYLRRNAEEISSTGDLELAILGLRAAGVAPRSFDGRNLVAELRERERSNGSYALQVNQTAFAILARSSAGEGTASLRGSAGWLAGVQNEDGGWGSVASAPSEADSTGAALQALALTGPDTALAAGARWLGRNQNRDGGWSLTESAGSNSQSAAWAIQGLVAAGVNPDRVRSPKRSGRNYLRARQASDGRYEYSSSSDQTPVWVTAQALAGRARAPYPLPEVARKEKAGADDSGSDPDSGTDSGSGADGGTGGTASGGSGSATNFGGSTASGFGSTTGSGFGGGQGGGNGGAGGNGFGAGAQGEASSQGGDSAGPDGAAELPSEQGDPIATFAEASEPDDSGGVSPILIIAAIAVAMAAGAGGGYWLWRQGWF